MSFPQSIGQAWLRGDAAQREVLERTFPALLAGIGGNPHLLTIMAQAERQAAFDALVLQNEDRN